MNDVGILSNRWLFFNMYGTVCLVLPTKDMDALASWVPLPRLNDLLAKHLTVQD